MNCVQVLAAVLVVGWASPLCGATINSNTIISAENSFPGEVVLIEDGESPPTVVQMIDGGEAQRMQLSGASILNIQGGRVAESIYVMGTSSVNIRGGEIASLTVSRGSSSANVFGGTIEREVWVSSSQGIATLNLFDGQLGDVVGSGGTFPFAINIHGGHMGWIRVSSSMSTSVLNITGGSFDRFTPRGQMTVDWSGGEPRAGYLYLWDDSTLNIYGRGLELHYVLGDEFLSGTLLDGTVLHDISISRITNAQVNLHNVPEPSAFGLAVIMIAPLLIRRGADRLKPFLAPRLLALALLAGFATPVGAVTIDYDTIISAENSFPGETVSVFDGESPPTVVQMIEGGEAGSIGLVGQSILNLHGGLVTGPIAAREESTVNVRGGSSNSLSVRDNASANIFGGTIESEVRILTGFGSRATLNIFGGLIRGNVVPDARGGILNIHGGRIGALFCTTISGSTKINISGGSLELFRVDANQVHWSGGELRSKLGVFLNDSVLNIYGHDLEMEDLANGKKLLSGTLLDGTDLANHFFAMEDNSQIILHNVPEPAAFGLAVVGVAVVVVCWSARRLGRVFGAIGDGVASYR